jgi:glutamate 5-kinase
MSAGESYQRIVVKVGTNLLTGNTDSLDMNSLEALVSELAKLQKDETQVILVTSGAIVAGRQILDPNGEHKETSFRQVLAAAGQSQLMGIYESLFKKYNLHIAQALLTRSDISDRVGYLNIRNTLISLIELGVIPIINENDVVAVDELVGETFGDNDMLSALVANLVDADILIILSDVSGLFSTDPHEDPNATLIQKVENIDASLEAIAGQPWSNRSKGGMETKLAAAKLANSSGIPVVVADGKEPSVLTRLVSGDSIGTLFETSSSRVESRKRWMLSGLSTKGSITVDVGAAKAIKERNSSLLPAGIREIDGDFQRGDIVYILSKPDDRIAYGITNYNSEDMDRIRGRKSEDIISVLGYSHGSEAIHRNNMVII